MLDLQYRYINAGDYEAAYALFADQSKALTPPDQYRAFFEENAPYSITDYSFPSVDVRGEAATVDVSFTIGDDEGQESASVTQELVCEGVWRVVMCDAQVAAFAEAGQETAQYEPPEQQQSGFERFVGDSRVHGSQMVIRPDFTGMKSHNVGPCADPVGPNASDAMCNEISQLEFSEAPSGGIVATVTSVDHETWEENPPPPGSEPDVAPETTTIASTTTRGGFKDYDSRRRRASRRALTSSGEGAAASAACPPPSSRARLTRR